MAADDLLLREFQVHKGHMNGLPFNRIVIDPFFGPTSTRSDACTFYKVAMLLEMKLIQAKNR